MSNVLLGLLDEGFVTGSNGKKADARNCMIILTSNLGAADREKSVIGFGEANNNDADDRAIKQYFKPEFRNRLDAVVKFNSLDKLSLRKIVAKLIAELNELLTDRNLRLRVTESAIDEIINKGYDQSMGARPLARKITELIRVPLSKKILFEKIKDGSIIQVMTDNNKDIKFMIVDQSNVKINKNNGIIEINDDMD